MKKVRFSSRLFMNLKIGCLKFLIIPAKINKYSIKMMSKSEFSDDI